MDMDTEVIDFSVTVPGKVILHGEHSVVYGKTAVAASLNLKTSLKFSVANRASCIVLDLTSVDFMCEFQIKDLKDFFKKHDVPLISDKPRRTFCLTSPELIDFEKLLELIKSFLESQKLFVSKQQENALLSFLCLFWGMFSSADVNLPNCHIKITSELDIGAGMGSSTAYNISLAAAFLQYIRRCKLQSFSDPCEISKEGYKSFRYWNADLQKFEKGELDLISRWGLFGDKIMHGNPSGIDNAVCTYGSVIEFRKGSHGPDIKMIPDPKLLKILLVNTKIPRETKKLVSKVASLNYRLSCVVEPILQAMDSVALSAAEALRRMSQMSENYDPQNSEALEDTLSGEISKLEELIDVNQKLLEALGVSHDALDEICRIARAEGLHGKLTGAGGGGYAFVMLPLHGSDKQLCAVKMCYEKLHFPVQQVTLGGPGVTLEDTSMCPSFVVKQSIDSLFSLPVEEDLPAPEVGGKIATSISYIKEPKTKVKEEEEFDEWPWPFDLREVVRNMFESHIKEELQGGEIALPLKSLCAVNVPDPLPQWVDKIAHLQTKISPLWRNLSRNKPHSWKDEDDAEDETKNEPFGPDSDLPNDAIMQYFGKQGSPTKDPTQIPSSKVSKDAPVSRLACYGKSRKPRKKVSMSDVLSDRKLAPKIHTDYHIPKQADLREGISAQMNHPTKLLKDQFPPYGKREWGFGIDLEENQKRLKNLQKKHKKFLKHQKPGCEHMSESYPIENLNV